MYLSVRVCVCTVRSPPQDLPADGQLFTHGLAFPALAFAVAGAVLLFGFLTVGTYRAIRDDEVTACAPILPQPRVGAWHILRGVACDACWMPA